MKSQIKIRCCWFFSAFSDISGGEARAARRSTTSTAVARRVARRRQLRRRRRRRLPRRPPREGRARTFGSPWVRRRGGQCFALSTAAVVLTGEDFVFFSFVFRRDTLLVHFRACYVRCCCRCAGSRVCVLPLLLHHGRLSTLFAVVCIVLPVCPLVSLSCVFPKC